MFLYISVMVLFSVYGQLWIMKGTKCNSMDRDIMYFKKKGNKTTVQKNDSHHNYITLNTSKAATIATAGARRNNGYFSKNKVGRWPQPILVVGLPKAGTVSLRNYFECGNEVHHVDGGVPLASNTSVQSYIESPIKVSHHRCSGRFCGGIIQKNMKNQHLSSRFSPLRKTGTHDVYTQLDVEANVDLGRPCYFPQIQALNNIHKYHPNSTFILNIRNVTDWIGSIRSWHNMDIRLSKCNIPNFPSSTNDRPTEEELTKFYNDHISYIRSFVQQYPSHRLVEIHLDHGDDEVGGILEQEFGILRSCWGKKNVNPRHQTTSKEIMLNTN